jgi:Tfp pilus assembly PilM family ATPase
MARAIGIDIGARYLKVVELIGGGRSFRVQRMAIREIPGSGPEEEVPEHELTEEDLSEDLTINDDDERSVNESQQIPPTREEIISELLLDVFKELKLPHEDVCAVFPSGMTIEREIMVPFFDEDQIKKVVRFEAENHLHSQSIDDVVVNWVKTGETKDGSRLTIFASPKQKLAEHVAIMRMARIDPASIDLDATATYTTLDATGLLDEHPNVIVVDIGASSTTLIMMVAGRPRVMRSFRLGVGSLEARIGAELGVSAAAGAGHARSLPRASSDDLLISASDLHPPARESEKSLAQLETDVVTDNRSAFVGKLHREAIRSLASVTTDTPPDRILLLGGGSLLPGVPEALAERFGLPTQTINLLDHIDCKDAGPDPAFTGVSIGPAVGAGLRMLGRDPLGIELLQDEFSPRNTFEVVRTTLATTITLLFLVIGLWVFAGKAELSAEKRKYNDIAGVVQRMTFKAEFAYVQGIEGKTKDLAEKQASSWVLGMPRDDKQVARMHALLIRRHQFLQDKLGLRSDIEQLRSGVEVWTEIYKALGDVPRKQLGTFFRIYDLNIQERRATVKIAVDDAKVFDLVRSLLTKSAYFVENAADQSNIVEAGSMNSLPNGQRTQSFSFRFRED